MQIWQKTDHAENIDSKCFLCNKKINNEKVGEWGMVIDWLGKSDEFHVCRSHWTDNMSYSDYEKLILKKVAEKEKLCRIYFTLSDVLESKERQGLFSKIKLKNNGYSVSNTDEWFEDKLFNHIENKLIEKKFFKRSFSVEYGYKFDSESGLGLMSVETDRTRIAIYAFRLIPVFVDGDNGYCLEIVLIDLLTAVYVRRGGYKENLPLFVKFYEISKLKMSFYTSVSYDFLWNGSVVNGYKNENKQKNLDLQTGKLVVVSEIQKDSWWGAVC